jgi:NTE family protein
VDPLHKKCKRIIAVHVNPTGIIEKIKSPIQVAERSFHLAIGSAIHMIREKVDLFIEPPGLSEFGMLEIKNAKEIYNVGYLYTKELLS